MSVDMDNDPFWFCYNCRAEQGMECVCEDMDNEPDLDFGYEHDSAMTSIGWGTDEDYGYYGGDEW